MREGMLGTYCIGWTTVDMLQFLWGRKYDDAAKAYIYGLRPSSVRIHEDGGGLTMDCQTWRVTVHLQKDLTVKRITQEIEVEIPDGCFGSGDLKKLL